MIFRRATRLGTQSDSSYVPMAGSIMHLSVCSKALGESLAKCLGAPEH
jgi:hypothetical protein